MLVVIQEILFLTDLTPEPANITSLYQFIAASEFVTEIKLPIVKKEAAEVEAKLEEMVAKQQLMLAGLNPRTLVTVGEVEMAAAAGEVEMAANEVQTAAGEVETADNEVETAANEVQTATAAGEVEMADNEVQTAADEVQMAAV